MGKMASLSRFNSLIARNVMFFVYETENMKVGRHSIRLTINYVFRIGQVGVATDLYRVPTTLPYSIYYQMVGRKVGYFMGLINEEVEIELNNRLITHYEGLGYIMPRIKKNYKWVIPQGTTIKVKAKDLPKSSNVYVNVKCDCPNCNNIKSIQYSKYRKNVERNGMYLCTCDVQHRDYASGLTKKHIIDSLKNFYDKNNRFPKNNEYTIENGFSFTYSTMLDRFRRYGTTLNDELAKINCYELSTPNVKYYDQYVEGLRKVIHENPQIGNNLYLLSRGENCKKYKLPNIRWFVNNCPDKTVNNIDTFKEWAGLYTRHMTKEQCTEIILDMAKKYDRPLMYDDFRGYKYGQVSIQMICNIWGSLNKMKQDLGLEINIDSMIDKQLSKDDFDDMITTICDFVRSDGRNFITTREINAHSNWSAYSTLEKYAKKYYSKQLSEIFEQYNISFGKQGCGINFTFSDNEHVTSQFEYMFSKYLKEKGLKYNIDYFRDVKYSTFIPNYKSNMNCDYVIHINGKIIYIEIAGILSEYKTWFYANKPISQSKSKEKYRQKLFKKEFLLKSNNLIYFILFPCDLTRENFENILTNPSLELKKKIEHFYQNNIDWVKIRNTTGELDYSKQFLRNAYVKKKIS